MKSLLTVLLLFPGLMAQAQLTGYQVGDAVKDFKLKGVDDKQVSLASYPAAKGYIIIFGCNTCPVSKAYEPRMIALHEQYASRGYPVIAINPNDPEAQPGEEFAQMQQHAKAAGFTFPYLEDPGQEVTRAFGAQRTPHVFVLQKTGKGNVVQYIGAIDNNSDGNAANRINYVEDAVNALLDGKKPPLTFTKAVGCGVKWKKSA